MAAKQDYARDSLEKDTVFVWSQGPSFHSCSSQQLNEIGRNYCVAAIKQSYCRAPDYVDYHFYNAFNYQRYKYSHSRNVVRVFSASNADPPIIQAPPSYIYRLRNDYVDMGEQQGDCTAAKGRFDDLLIDPGAMRPWGPGIMYDAVLPFLINAGFKRIVVIGWDLTASIGDWKSYAGMPVERKGIRKKLDGTLESMKLYLAESVFGEVFRFGNLSRKHYFSQRYNSYNCNLKFEEDVVIGSSGLLHEWLEMQGVELLLCSDCSRLSSKIPRTSLSEWV